MTSERVHDGRAARATKNQIVYRELNEQLKDLYEGFGLDRPLEEWVCECANVACLDRVKLAPAEYDAIRAHNGRFAVLPDEQHVMPIVERVVERHQRYWVVEKTSP